MAWPVGKLWPDDVLEGGRAVAAVSHRGAPMQAHGEAVVRELRALAPDLFGGRGGGAPRQPPCYTRGMLACFP